MAEAEQLRVSRVGKVPVPVPGGVSIEIDGNTVTVKGPKGELVRTFHPLVKIEQDGAELKVVPSGSGGKTKFAQFQGLSRALLRNMVQGCHEGYKTSLDLYGVGYRATVSGGTIALNLGLSHQIDHALHPAVKAKVETIDEGGTKRPRLHLESHDKEALGQTAAQIRSYRPPEPYKGKGVRYTGEHVREKAGKAGA